MWGMTPISEAVIQLRGDGGARRCRGTTGAVSGNGGVLSTHSTLVLSRLPRERRPEAAAAITPRWPRSGRQPGATSW